MTFVMAQGLAAVFLVRIPFAWWASARPEPDVFTVGLSSVLAAVFVLAANIVCYAKSKSRAASASRTQPISHGSSHGRRR